MNLVEVSQYYPSICLQFWCRPDKTPKRLQWPPIIIFSSISTVANWFTQPIKHGQDFSRKVRAELLSGLCAFVGVVSQVQFTTS